MKIPKNIPIVIGTNSNVFLRDISLGFD